MTRNQRISFCLKEAGIEQGVLGKELGTTQAAISKRLNRDKQIESVDFLLAVSRLTGKSIHYLYHGSEDEGTRPVQYVSSDEDQNLVIDDPSETMRAKPGDVFELIEELRKEVELLKKQVNPSK